MPLRRTHTRTTHSRTLLVPVRFGWIHRSSAIFRNSSVSFSNSITYNNNNNNSIVKNNSNRLTCNSCMNHAINSSSFHRHSNNNNTNSNSNTNTNNTNNTNSNNTNLHCCIRPTVFHLITGVLFLVLLAVVILLRLACQSTGHLPRRALVRD